MQALLSKKVCDGLSAHLNQPVTRFEMRGYLGPSGVEPLQQRAVGSIAYSKPDDHRTLGRASCAFSKVFIFGDNDRAAAQRVVPDYNVVSIAQVNIINMVLRSVPG